jgi:hypothetical protein
MEFGRRIFLLLLAAARDAGAEPLFFEDHDWVKVKVQGKYLKEVSVTDTD